MWYFTTQVSRATLPSLPAFGALTPSIPIALLGMQDVDLDKLLTKLNLLQDTHQFVHRTSSHAAGYDISWSEASVVTAQIKPNARELQVRSPSAHSDRLEEVIVTNLVAIFKDERSKMASIVCPELVPRDLRVVKYNPTYELVFSLLNGGGTKTIDHWPIEKSLNKFIQPVLKDLEVLATFSLESQVQYYADLTFTPVRNESSGAHILQKSDLKNFINSAEWNLATAQSGSKPLNFILYVPKVEHRPLLIMDGAAVVESNSFLLPQFGSIVIHNPPVEGHTAELRDAVLDNLVDISSSHLLTLMGLPNIPATLGESSKWRRDGLLRLRCLENLLSAQHTLKSIPKIVDQIPNMHVPARIAVLIDEALKALDAARAALDTGDVESALRNSKLAVHSAEQAFFDDKMVSLLYFPDEHKYGVYMPLFGPLFLPLLTAGIKELQYFLKKRKRTLAAPGSQSSQTSRAT